MDLRLAGKTVLITGASKGIGLACAELFAEEGCDLHLVARTGADLERARDTIRGRHNVAVTIHPLDLSDGGNVKRLVSETGESLDIVVNNAGAIPGGPIHMIDEERWREAWDLKVFGYINMCRELYPVFQAKRAGVIVNVVGTGGERPSAGYIAGAGGNAGLIAFTRALGGKSPDDGFRIVGVNPGPILTERLTTIMRAQALDRFGDEERWEECMPTNPPPGESEDCADLVVFLASERAKHISGTVVTIDGGAVSR